MQEEILPLSHVVHSLNWNHYESKIRYKVTFFGRIYGRSLRDRNTKEIVTMANDAYIFRSVDFLSFVHLKFQPCIHGRGQFDFVNPISLTSPYRYWK